jgi:hypothetical protein
VKLLRSQGLRDAERMREDELREALARLRILLPHLDDDERPSSPSMAASEAAAPMPAMPDDADDPHALPRFREPRPRLPESDRTFLRLASVKPRTMFMAWDMRGHDVPQHGQVQAWLYGRSFLGDPPGRDELLASEPFAVTDVHLDAHGWYVNVPGERLAVVATLVQLDEHGAHRLITSNVALCVPGRHAPPGPNWLATLPPSLDRRLLKGSVLKNALPEGASVEELGESIALPEALSHAARDVGELRGELPGSQTFALSSSSFARGEA